MQNKLLIYIPKITPRHQYIFKVLFNELYFIEYSLTDNKETYLASEEIKLNYSTTSICIDEIFIESNGLLTEKGINEIDIKVQLINNQSVFFTSTNGNAYPFDLFAASFYLISRYEEYLPHLKDTYNRYKAEESLAFKHGFLEKGGSIVDLMSISSFGFYKKKNDSKIINESIVFDAKTLQTSAPQISKYIKTTTP